MGLYLYLYKQTFLEPFEMGKTYDGCIEITYKGREIPINIDRVNCIEEEILEIRFPSAIAGWLCAKYEIKDVFDGVKRDFQPEEWRQLYELLQKAIENPEEVAQTLLYVDEEEENYLYRFYNDSFDYYVPKFLAAMDEIYTTPEIPLFVIYCFDFH